MKLTLEIKMDNAAFDNDAPGIEAARILREAAERLEEFGSDDFFFLMDINGNKVGELEVTEEEE